ncbi:MAG: IPT/TIG domain-containing protein [bacterium]
MDLNFTINTNNYNDTAIVDSFVYIGPYSEDPTDIIPNIIDNPLKNGTLKDAVTELENDTTYTVNFLVTDGKQSSSSYYTCKTGATKCGIVDITYPIIDDFIPVKGKVGDIVTIKGYNFIGTTSVTFGSMEAQINSISIDKILVTVPSGVGDSKITVKTPKGTVTSTQIFTTGTINTKTTYTPLAPLPGVGTPGCVGDDGKPCIETQKNDTTNPCPFGDYLNVMIKLFFGICGVLAVIMITMGGIQYMTSELVSSKEAGKESITHAIFGLLLALSAYLILNTINPDLLNACLNNIKTVDITITPELNKTSPNPVAGSPASCKIAPSPCSPAELTAFGNKATGMSMICNIESRAQNIASQTDICSDGNHFSFGLFQINLLANGKILNSNGTVNTKGTGDCANLFDKKSVSPVNGKYTCNLTADKKLFNACSNALLNPNTNKAIALELFNEGTRMNPSYPQFAWSADRACTQAFQ